MTIEDQIRELQLQLADLMRKNVKLEEENEKHRKKMSSLQFIERGKADEKEKQDRLSQKLVSMGYVTQNQMNNVLKRRQNDEDSWVLLHPDNQKLINKLSQISKKLSNTKKKRDGQYPLLRRGDRSNKYTPQDFINFGNKIIEAFMVLDPIDQWGVRWDLCDKRQGGDGYEDPFSPASSY